MDSWMATSSGVPFLKNPAGPAVEAFGILADDHKIDVLRPLILEGGVHAGIELDGTKVDVLVEDETQTEENALFQDAGFYIGVTDGPEEDRLHFPEFPDDRIRQGSRRS